MIPISYNDEIFPSEYASACHIIECMAGPPEEPCGRHMYRCTFCGDKFCEGDFHDYYHECAADFIDVREEETRKKLLKDRSREIVKGIEEKNPAYVTALLK